jgi:hypothetical protein
MAMIGCFSSNRDAEMKVFASDCSNTNRWYEQWTNRLVLRRMLNPLNFIGYELSLIPEVRRVLVRRDTPESTELDVVIFVTSKDAALRSRIYDRERAIMDELTGLEFDFHIFAHEGGNFAELINETGELAFEKR